MNARMDRYRLAAALLASVAICQLNAIGLLGAAAVLALCAFVAVFARQPALRSAMLRRAGSVTAFVAMLWLLLPWSIDAAGIHLAEAGVDLAARISLRTEAAALACISLLAGMDAFALARAAAGLGLPDRLARLLAMTVRHLAVLDDTRRRIDLAMRARGFHPRADLRSAAVIAQQVALVLVHAVLRAERVELALRARGFAPARPLPAAAPAWRHAAGAATACCLLWLML